MKFRSIAVAALVATSGSAFAVDLGTIDNMTIPVFSLKSESFFQDFFDFNITNSGAVSGAVLSSGIAPFVVTLISDGMTVDSDTSPDSFSFGGLAAGSYTLSLLGFTAESGGGYGGYIQAAVVPEPETYAMMLAGLGVLGFLASRRRREG